MTAGRHQPSPIVSVGYEGRTLEELVGAVARAGVEVVVDVRLNPVSRKPGMSKGKLSEALGASGIEYRHVRALGNPTELRAPFQRGEPDARRSYAERLDTEGAESLAELTELVHRQVVALLCVERDHEICHRSAVAARIIEEGGDRPIVVV